MAIAPIASEIMALFMHLDNILVFLLIDEFGVALPD
jgi:hypothetical protein